MCGCEALAGGYEEFVCNGVGARGCDSLGVGDGCKSGDGKPETYRASLKMEKIKGKWVGGAKLLYEGRRQEWNDGDGELWMRGRERTRTSEKEV